MKRFILLVLVFCVIIPVFGADEPEKMRVIVERENEISKAKPSDGVYIKTEPKKMSAAQRVAERKKKTEELKGLVESSEMEKEVMDAIIGKIIDIESDMERQSKTDRIIIACLAAAIIALLIVILVRTRK